ncbi:unnamed protein product [Haemonchus placei]|uniref:Ovule protein n=1 Tax=Haemonchus placei TaxID=6290 RepID=A0A0N4WAV1_HAEPC|nr:unnamed protein product [Haemonchus placei]
MKVESQGLEIASIKSSLKTVAVVIASTPVKQSVGTNQKVEHDVREVKEEEGYEDSELVKEYDAEPLKD